MADDEDQISGSNFKVKIEPVVPSGWTGIKRVPQSPSVDALHNFVVTKPPKVRFKSGTKSGINSKEILPADVKVKNIRKWEEFKNIKG